MHSVRAKRKRRPLYFELESWTSRWILRPYYYRVQKFITRNDRIFLGLVVPEDTRGWCLFGSNNPCSSEDMAQIDQFIQELEDADAKQTRATSEVHKG